MKTSGYLSHERQNTHAVVSQDTVRHLVTCSHKPRYFLPPQKQHLIFINTKIGPARPNPWEMSYTSIRVLHLSQNVYKLCFSNIYKFNFSDGAGKGRTRQRLYPAKCPNGVKLLVNQIRKIQARLRGTTHKAQWKLPRQRAKCLTRNRLTRNSNPWVSSNVYLTRVRCKSLN